MIATEIAKALPRAFQLRQSADYDDFAELSAERIRDARAEAVQFVAACEAMLERMIRADPDG